MSCCRHHGRRGNGQESLDYHSTASAAAQATSSGGASGGNTVRGLRVPRTRTVLKWVLALLIGVATGFVGFLLSLCVANLNGVRFQLVFRYLPASTVGSFLLYAMSNLVLVGLACCVVVYFGPAAAGSGIPDVKCYLNGINSSGVLSVRTLVAKITGSLGAVSGFLAVGKEGPMVHTGACLAALFGRSGEVGKKRTALDRWLSLPTFCNDFDRRDLVTLGAAAGVAAAFKAPIGGVLFVIEEACTHWRAELTWRAFFTCAITSYTIRLLNSMCASGGDRCGFYEGGGLVLFPEASFGDFHAAQAVLQVLLAAACGLSGAAFVWANTALCRWRRRRQMPAWAKLVECLLVSAVTSTAAYWLPVLGRCVQCDSAGESGSSVVDGATGVWGDSDEACGPGNKYFAEFTRFQCTESSYNDLAVLLFNPQDEAIRALLSSSAGAFTASSLAVFAFYYWWLTTLTYGIAVPSGLFIPSMLFGAATGRLLGSFMSTLPHIFGNVDVSSFALLGATAFMGGAMRITISLCAILLEITQANRQLPAMMLVVTIAKAVGDRFGESIYDSHITLKGMPLLEQRPERGLENCRAGGIATRSPVCLRPLERVARLQEVLSSTAHNAFPVVVPLDVASSPAVGVKMRAVGLVSRSHLLELLATRHFLSEQEQHEYDEAEASGRPRSYTEERKSLLASVDRVVSRRPGPEDADEDIFDADRLVDLQPFVRSTSVMVPEGAKLPEVHALFRSMSLRHLLVVGTRAELLGVITRADVLCHDKSGIGHTRHAMRSQSASDPDAVALEAPLLGAGRV